MRICKTVSDYATILQLLCASIYSNWIGILHIHTSLSQTLNKYRRGCERTGNGKELNISQSLSLATIKKSYAILEIKQRDCFSR